MSIKEHIPAGVELGVGLVLEEGEHYLFCIAGDRHVCPEGQLFFAGIGGHLEEGENLIECARREAKEEINCEIEILTARETYRVQSDGEIKTIDIDDSPRPLALFDMLYPEGSPQEGKVYYIVIYRAKIKSVIRQVKEDEVRAVISLSRKHVTDCLEAKPSINELISEGADIVIGKDNLDPETRLYPIGTARALALLWRDGNK